jgi:hypothetical protein
LAYIFGFFGCWAYASALLRKDRLPADIPAERRRFGYVNERGSEFSASSIASMIEARPSAPRGMK